MPRYVYLVVDEHDDPKPDAIHFDLSLDVHGVFSTLGQAKSSVELVEGREWVPAQPGFGNQHAWRGMGTRFQDWLIIEYQLDRSLR